MDANNKTIIVLLPNHFDARQFDTIKNCIVGAGGRIIVAGRKKGELLSDKKSKQELAIDMSLEETTTVDYGGILILDSSTPEEMKASRGNLGLIKRSYESKALIGAVDKGIELLVAALGAQLNGFKLAGPLESRTYLESVGAILLDIDVVVDRNIVTARSSNNTEEFCRFYIKEIGLSRGLAA
jgi:protease I